MDSSWSKLPNLLVSGVEYSSNDELLVLFAIYLCESAFSLSALKAAFSLSALKAAISALKAAIYLCESWFCVCALKAAFSLSATKAAISALKAAFSDLSSCSNSFYLLLPFCAPF